MIFASIMAAKTRKKSVHRDTVLVEEDFLTQLALTLLLDHFSQFIN